MLPRGSSSRSLSWMDDEPLYSHLDRERCVWEFSKWLPVEDWLEQCGARRQGEDHSATGGINITVHSAYIQLDYRLATYTLTGEHSTVFAHISSSSIRAVFLPPPIHTFPKNRDKSNGDAHIFPIAIQQNSESESTVFQVYFYSLLPLRGDRKTYAAAVANTTTSSTSSSPPTLLHADTIGNASKKIWLWEFVGATLPTTIQVVLYPTSDHQVPPCEADCAVNDGDDDAALQFSLAIASDGGGFYRPALKAIVTIQHDPDVVSNRTETFTLGKKLILVTYSNLMMALMIFVACGYRYYGQWLTYTLNINCFLGESVYIVFDLDPALEIQAGFTFAVSELRLCQRTEAAPLPLPGGACFNLLRTTVTVKI